MEIMTSRRLQTCKVLNYDPMLFRCCLTIQQEKEKHECNTLILSVLIFQNFWIIIIIIIIISIIICLFIYLLCYLNLSPILKSKNPNLFILNTTIFYTRTMNFQNLKLKLLIVRDLNSYIGLNDHKYFLFGI